MKSLQQAAGCLAIVFLLQLLSFSCTTAVQFTNDPAEARRIARNAYVLLTPAVINWGFLANSSFRIGFDNFRHLRVPFFPNDNILYSIAWLDLRQEAKVVSVPPIGPGRYYSLHIIDQYTHNLGIASERTIRPINSGGTFAVTRSREGDCSIPSHGECLSFIDDIFCSEGDYVLLLIRIQFFSRLDIRFNVRSTQNSFGITELSTFCGVPGPIPLPDPVLFRFQSSRLETLDFFSFANEILETIDTNEFEIDDFEEFEEIGVIRGAPFPPPELPQNILDAIELGIELASAEIDAEIRQFAEGVKIDGWQVLARPPQFGTREVMQDRFLTRAGAARGALYGLDPEEAMYEFARESAEGTSLDASNGQAYHILFNPNEVPPVFLSNPTGYWSLTMHDASTNSFVPNILNRFSLGSRDLSSLCTYQDGSFPIVMQSQVPAGFSNNWLPAPDSEFFLVMRLYLPMPDAINLPYLPPGVKLGLPPVPTNCP